MPNALDRPINPSRCPAPLRALAGAVLMLSLGVASGSATAQTGNRPQPAPTQAQSPAGQKSGAATRQAQPAGDPVDAQLGEIKKRLNITAAQQSQFDQFAATVKQNAQAMEAVMQKAGQSAERNAVEGLRTAADFAQTEADNLKRLVPALDALYASFTDQQKRTADQLFNTAPSSGATQGQAQGKRKG
jgi:periplasmic protein CpxP/Spy